MLVYIYQNNKLLWSGEMYLYPRMGDKVKIWSNGVENLYVVIDSQFNISKISGPHLQLSVA